MILFSTIMDIHRDFPLHLFTGALRWQIIECDCFHVQSGSNRWPTLSAVSAERQRFIFCTYTACSYVAGECSIYNPLPAHYVFASSKSSCPTRGLNSTLISAPTQFDSHVLFSTSAGREGRCDALYSLHSELDRRNSGALPLVLAIRHGPRWLQWRQTWPDALVSQINVPDLPTPGLYQCLWELVFTLHAGHSASSS